VWAGVLSACAGGAWTAPANGNPANEKSLDVVHVQASNPGASTRARTRDLRINKKPLFINDLDSPSLVTLR